MLEIIFWICLNVILWFLLFCFVMDIYSRWKYKRFVKRLGRVGLAAAETGKALRGANGTIYKWLNDEFWKRNMREYVGVRLKRPGLLKKEKTKIIIKEIKPGKNNKAMGYKAGEYHDGFIDLSKVKAGLYKDENEKD